MSDDPADGSAAGSVALDSPTGRLVVTTTVAGSAVAMLTATVVNVALPALATDLDASSSQQQWVVNSYLLTIASLILVGGSLGDRYGRLKIYRIGVAGFAVASLACAVAPSVGALIAARLVQGVAGALLTPGSLAIIEATLRPDDRGRGVGQWSGLSGIAGALGPLVGGALVDLSWRWVFVLNVPVAIAVLAMSVRLPESFDPDAQESRLDLTGAWLTVVVLGGSSYALIEGPPGGWSGLDVGAAVVAVLALVGLIVVEPRREHAMVPIDLFGDRVFAAANLMTLLVYGGMGVVFFLLSIQLQVTVGWSPLAAGGALLPITGLMLVLSSRAGAWAQRVGPRIPLTVGPLLIAIGMLMYRRVGPDASYLVDVLPGVIVFGLGLSASVAPVTSTALGAAPETRAGAASGANNAIARTGQLLAVAAIPPLVGLTGDALGDPVELDDGFRSAMIVGAALVAAGGVVAATLLPSRRPDDAPVADQPVCCPIDGPAAHAVDVETVDA
ncbi:MAG: MFS transporter [Actinomycetota bacterium]